LEETSVEEAEAHFATIFFGTVRVLRAVLPVMRRQARGRIIVIGSIGGLIGLPFLGHYSAGKFALDGLIEALRTEVQPFGIEATIVHPGNFDTALRVNRTLSRDTNTASPYFAAFERTLSFYQGKESKARGPHEMARKIDALLSRRRLPVRYVIGTPLEMLGVWAKAFLPSRTFEFLVRRAYGPRDG